MAEDAALTAKTGEPATAHAVWVAWEQLRLAFNGLLGLETLVLVGVSGTLRLPVGFLVMAAIGANVCFCAGPVAEGYLAAIGLPRRVGRWLVFGLGCIAGAGLTALSLLGVLLKFD